MATFPAGKLTANGYKYQRVSTVERTPMEAGPVKQARISSYDYLNFPVTYLFTRAEFVNFQDWVKDTIKVVGTFDWVEPVSETTMVVRIVGGDITNAAPLNPDMADWLVSFTLEVLDDG